MIDLTAGKPTYRKTHKTPDQTPVSSRLFEDATKIVRRLSQGSNPSELSRLAYPRFFTSFFRDSTPQFDTPRTNVEFVSGFDQRTLQYSFREGTVSIMEYEGTILTSLEEHGYALTSLSNLRAILAEYRFLLPLMIEAKDQLMTLYPEATFHLKPMTLSDDTGGIELRVELSGNVDASYDLLDQFDETWWLPNLDRAGGRVSVILDFV